MPEKLPPVEGGVFRSTSRQREVDEEVATDLAAGAQTLADPRAGSVFLSLVNRLSTLEAAARTERLRRLTSEEKQEILVLDNQEAQEKISQLQAELATAVGAGEAALTDLRERFTRLRDLADAAVAAFRSGSIALELAGLGGVFATLGLALVQLEGEPPVELPPPFRPPPTLPLP